MNRRDRGQSTVELALSLPLLCLFVCGLLQVAVVVRNQVAVQLAAREAARAAAVAADPQTAARLAAEQAIALDPLQVSIVEHDGAVTAQVRFIDHTDVPFIGMFMPDVVITASVTMAAEPP
ncbi:MAG: TadE/TadG family type IV pilus assembly protein [Actinomycetota bacterium]|nr:TadE/TadG family type IV pilus assembly protein [Actinomycetota bacterium]